jgi:uncharacterized protein YndB with AHSA1/START domain
VGLTSDHRFEYPASQEAVWEALSRVSEYRSWWPWLRGFDAVGLKEGDLWRCVIQPPAPYLLRFTVELTGVDRPRTINATIAGDVSGTATIAVASTPSGSALRIRSELQPVTNVLRALFLVARPAARRSHDWVIKTGARQFGQRAL